MIINKIKYLLLNNPKLLCFLLISQISPGIINFKSYKSFKSLNLKNSYFTISLDCDTIEDLKIIPKLQNKFTDMNIYPTYAVPGELILKDKNLFKDLKSQGSEFINHGFNLHTEYNKKNKRYKSTHFYNDYTNEQIKNDITQGHEILSELLNEEPKGFRTPHFGTIVKEKTKQHIYKILKDLNYLFSTSTIPSDQFWSKPIYKKNEIIEIPITGSFDKPNIIMDSWNFKYAENRYFRKNDYSKQILKIKDYFKKKNTNFFINIYVDPSHVYYWDNFFEAINSLQQLVNINYMNFIKNLNLQLKS